MRARNIKPGFFKNEYLAECSPLARLLFAGLWCMADREGRLEYRPKRIKAEVLPYDNGSIEKMVEELQSKNFLQVYSVNGDSYINIINFHRHQNPHVRESESSCPAPDEHSAEHSLGDAEHRSSPADSPILIPDSPILKTPLPPKKRGDEYEQDFLTFWNAYPKKAKKPTAYREWQKLGRKRPDIAALTACIQRQATWRPWIEGYIPDPERWLKNERWLDEPPPVGGNGNGKGIRTSRTDPRDPALQSREDAEVAAILAKRAAAKQSARRDPRGDAKPDDAPDFSAIGPTG